MATLGHVKAFLPESNCITMYLERIDLLITTNKVEKDRKSAVLLSFVGKNVYATQRDLLTLAMPQNKLFNELKEAFIANYEPKPTIIAKRFTFISPINIYQNLSFGLLRS